MTLKLPKSAGSCPGLSTSESAPSNTLEKAVEDVIRGLATYTGDMDEAPGSQLHNQQVEGSPKSLPITLSVLHSNFQWTNALKNKKSKYSKPSNIQQNCGKYTNLQVFNSKLQQDMISIFLSVQNRKESRTFYFKYSEYCINLKGTKGIWNRNTWIYPQSNSKSRKITGS